MTYLGHKYLYPIVNKGKFFRIFKNSYARKAVQPKIIIKGLNLLDACIDLDGSIIPGKSTLIIIDSNIEKLKFLLAIINSRLSFFYIRERYPSSSYNLGTTFTKEMINNLPLPHITNNVQQPFIDLVDKILAAKQKDPSADTSALEQQIDEMVYKLYGLTEDEIKIIEGV